MFSAGSGRWLEELSWSFGMVSSKTAEILHLYVVVLHRSEFVVSRSG